MELKNLNTVKIIVETGSFQKAAAALNYAQSTITFQVHQLERELGITLFEKTGNRMQLTADGQAIYPLMEQILRDRDQLLSFHREAQPSGELKILLPESLVTYQMQPVLHTFKQKAPEVQLRLQVLNCFSIYDEMIDGRADIAIHYDVRKYPSAFSLQTLHTYPLVMIASPELEESERDFITPNQHKNLCFILNDPNALFMKKLRRYLRQKNITFHSEMELWSIESVKQSVISNLGVSMLPRFTVEEELADGRLVELPLEMDDPTMTAVYVYNKNKWDSPAARLFREITCQHFAYRT